MKKRIFLLGGTDLEMDTIKSLLKREGECCVCRDLRWGNAVLSAYQKELEQYGDNPSYQLYGIELREDVAYPTNYIAIDHHNERASRESSLEQVAMLLGISLSRYEQLVAINDSRYIPGLIDFGASEKEIAEIRLADRRVQGVTEQEEQLAEQAVETQVQYGDLVVVETKGSSFSAVCDRLFPYDRLVVYNGHEMCMYGRACQRVRREIEQKWEVSTYYGGGENGYWGIGVGMVSSKVLEMMIEQIIKRGAYV